MMTQQEMATMALCQARSNAILSLDRVAANMREYADKLDRRCTEVKQVLPVFGKSSVADVVNWAINDVENFVRNINFAQLASAQAQLQIALSNQAAVAAL